jgi:hypothetical protein
MHRTRIHRRARDRGAVDIDEQMVPSLHGRIIGRNGGLWNEFGQLCNVLGRRLPAARKRAMAGWRARRVSTACGVPSFPIAGTLTVAGVWCI